MAPQAKGEARECRTILRAWRFTASALWLPRVASRIGRSEEKYESDNRRCLQKPPAQNDTNHADLPVERLVLHRRTRVLDRPWRGRGYLQSGHCPRRA